jgi:hypothetical protein
MHRTSENKGEIRLKLTVSPETAPLDTGAAVLFFVCGADGLELG